MTDQLSDRFRRWFDYERDCHARVLASLEAVPAPVRASALWQQAVDLLGHLVAARRLWLFRFGVAPQRPGALFPRDLGLDALRTDLGGMEEAWMAYLDRLDAAELGRVFTYRSTEGDWFRNSVEEILTQLFGHAWYHRGQIALLVRMAGGEPAVTDYVFRTRVKTEGG